MLLITLAEHTIAGGQRIARQLLVLFKYMLRGAADLDPIRAVRFECAVGVVLRLTTAPAPIAAPLPLHTFEISHLFQLLWPAPEVAPLICEL
jgi:hypothetical protein